MTLITEIGSDSPCSPLMFIDKVSSHGPTIGKPKMSKPCSPNDEHPFQPSAPQFLFLHDPPKNPSPKSKPSDMGPIRE
jgi:hypothetical protein